MTTPFTTFAFATSGVPPLPPATTPPTRTLPNRLQQDIHNVLDYGADPTGATDSLAAINACLNWNTVTYPSLTNNVNASFTGTVAYCGSFQASISAGVLTASATNDPTFGTLSLGALAVNSYTYNPSNGLVTLTMASTVGFNPGVGIVVQGLNIGPLNIVTSAVSATGTTVTFTGPTGLSGTPTGGGTIVVGGQLVAGHTFSGSNTFTVNSYTYVSGSGLVTLTLAGGTPASFNVGDTIHVSGLNIANLNGSFTAASVSSGTVTYTGPTGQAGTPSAGGSFSVSFSFTISSQATGPAGGAGTYNLTVSDSFTQTITTSTTQCLMTASSVTGTINIGDWPLNQAGTDASPSAVVQDVFSQTKVSSQQSGTAGGAGVYVLSIAQNFASGPLLTIGNQIFVNCPFPGSGIVDNDYVKDLSNASIGHPSEPTLPSVAFFNGVSQITFGFLSGIIQVGDQIQFIKQTKGNIYFPAGTYLVSQPIIMLLSIPDNWTAQLIGDGASSIITGNFADFILKRQTFGFSSYITIEQLNLINTNATGGGIRLGGVVLGRISDCTIAANRAINLFGSDNHNDIQGGNLSQEISVDNCEMNAGANYTGSIGVATGADGPYRNLRIIGYQEGFLVAGGQNGQGLFGCYFEKCGEGLKPAWTPDGFGSSSNIQVFGCWFKNCNTAITWQSSNSGLYYGIKIEGSDGQAPLGVNCQYGLLNGNGGGGDEAGNMLIGGMVVTGNYDIAGIYLNGNTFNTGIQFIGITASNGSSTSGAVDWKFFDLGGVWSVFPDLIACNTQRIYTVAGATKKLQEEGDLFNVSDANTTTWATPVSGGGSTHGLIRYNGTAFTLVGK